MQEDYITYEIYDGRVYIEVTTDTIWEGQRRTDRTIISRKDLRRLFPYEEEPEEFGTHPLPHPELFWTLFDPELNFPPAEKVVEFSSVRWPTIHSTRSYVLDHIFRVYGNGEDFFGGALFRWEGLSWDKDEIASQNEAEHDAKVLLEADNNFWVLMAETPEEKEEGRKIWEQYQAERRKIYRTAAETYPLPESHRIAEEKEHYKDLGAEVPPPHFSHKYSFIFNLPLNLREDWVAMAKENALYNLPKAEEKDRALLEKTLARINELWPNV